MQLELGRAYAASGRTAAACLALEDQEELAAERYPTPPAATR